MESATDALFERMRATEDKALRNELGLVSHERECAIRYSHINENLAGMSAGMATINRNMRNFATAGAGILLTALGFLIKIVFFP
jgi:hypothetical protein